MEKYTEYMENNINCINLDSLHMPLVEDCDIITASDSFLHIDRIADFNVLIYVTDGAMYVTEDNVDHIINPGELLFLKSGIRHYGKYETLRGTRWLYAHFRLEEYPYGNTLSVPKKICGLSGSETEDKLLELCRIFHSGDLLSNFSSNARLYEIMLDICSESKLNAPSLADRICSFLDSQTDKDFSKELLKKHFFLSYSHLAAEFKKKKGISMGQYHNEIRMKKACKLLRSTLMSVGEIADELGFSDMLYFSKKFHSFSGASPTEYRRQVQMKY